MQALAANWLQSAQQAVEAQLAMWEAAGEEQQRRAAVSRAMAAVASGSDWQSVVDAEDPEFAKALLDALPDMPPAEAAVSLRGCARLGLELGQPLGPALHAVLLRVLPLAEPAEVADCLWAWHGLDGGLDGELAAAAAAAVQRAARGMHHQALLRTLAAFDRGPGWRGRLVDGALRALRQGLLRMLPCMAPRTMEGCLANWGRLAGGASLGGLAYHEDRELVTAAEAALLRVVPALSPQQASNILQAATAAGWQLGMHAAEQLAHRAAMEVRVTGLLAPLASS